MSIQKIHNRLIHNHLGSRSIESWLHDISSNYGGEQDYSLHLPQKFRTLGIIGGSVVVAALIWHVWSASVLSLAVLGLALLHTLPVVIGVILLWSTRGLRLRIRQRMVQSIDWRGNESVLDVGTGSGITLIGCAQQLTTGQATGIDHWDPNAGGADADTFWENVESAGVRERTELHNMDIRQVDLDDESFDVIMSSFAVHHFGNAQDRRQAASEMARILKPRGRIVICDLSGPLTELESEFKKHGINNIRRSGWGIQILSGEKLG